MTGHCILIGTRNHAQIDAIPDSGGAWQRTSQGLIVVIDSFHVSTFFIRCVRSVLLESTLIRRILLVCRVFLTTGGGYRSDVRVCRA